jgi:GntR family transcriptional regulator/MocR family aminotransferase
MVKRAGGALLQSIEIDRASSRTIGAQLASGLRDLILTGSLKAGERLPASRTLANDLDIARTTVIDTFEQLASEGLLESRIGAGTFISQALNAERPLAAERRGAVEPVARARVARSMSAATGRFAHRLPHEPRAFTTAMPAFDALPLAQWSRLAAKHWRSPRHGALGYGEPQGYRPLRQAIAAHLRANRGMVCDWRQIFVVAGAQNAFQLIAGALVDPGDLVWFENPGAIGARNSLVLAGADLVSVPVDDNGLVVEQGLATAPRFKLAFVTPAHQQPLGAKMSLERRFALLQAAEAARAWIIEDDYDGEFCFAGRPLPALKGIDATGRVIYVGTFSKSLFPSLRLGFFVAPPALMATFEMALGAFSPGVPTSLQAIVSDFIAEGLFATHIRRMRKLYAERHQVFLDAARARLSEWLDVVPTTTGLHTVGLLRAGLVGADVAAAAAQRGLTVAPISRFCIEPIAAEGLVLGFSGITPAQIKAGVAVLAEVLADCAHRADAIGGTERKPAPSFPAGIAKMV